jgi:hypothetical protein
MDLALALPLTDITGTAPFIAAITFETSSCEAGLPNPAPCERAQGTPWVESWPWEIRGSVEVRTYTPKGFERRLAARA